MPHHIQPYGTFLVSFSGVSVSAVQDLFEIKAPTDAVVSIDEICFQQCDLSVTAEVLDYSLKRYSGAPTSGSGGSSVTPEKVFDGAGAVGSTTEKNNTTQLTGGTKAYDKVYGLHTLRDKHIVFQEEEIIILSPGQYFVWSLNDVPSSTLSVNAWVKFSEFGG